MAHEHVTYEIDRLSHWSEVIVERSMFAVEDESYLDVIFDYVRQATLENALLHLRCVVEFLTAPRPTEAKKDRFRQLDVVADDYFDAGWADRPPFLLGEDEKAHYQTLNEIHRRLAHITGQRLTFPYSWTPVLLQVRQVLTEYKRLVRDLRVAHTEHAKAFDRSIHLLNARESGNPDAGIEIILPADLSTLSVR
jgi:hypothetical protein